MVMDTLYTLYEYSVSGGLNFMIYSSRAFLMNTLYRIPLMMPALKYSYISWK